MEKFLDKVVLFKVLTISLIQELQELKSIQTVSEFQVIIFKEMIVHKHQMGFIIQCLLGVE
jgi:hypothetical protein